jgi:hypothetical protein
MWPGSELPHWVHLFSFGARQRCDALRVRRRIFEVFLLGTPMVVDVYYSFSWSSAFHTSGFSASASLAVSASR